MNVHISKGTRTVKLTKRERDLLTGASALLHEIAHVTIHETAENADEAAGRIGQVLTLLGANPVTEPVL